MKDIILEVVNRSSGIKAVDLALKVMEKVNPTVFDTEDFHKSFDTLIKDGEIIELEYIDPDTDYRIKSILFKKGTAILNNEVSQIPRESQRDPRRYLRLFK